MDRRLSSILVPLYKLFPLLAGFFFLTTFVQWVSLNFPIDWWWGFPFLILWGGIFYFSTRRWKNIYLCGDKILVSDFFKKIEIPVSEIKYIEASSWWGWQPRTITIKLKSKTKFGEEIVFVPRGFGYTAGLQAEELKGLFNLK